MNLLSSIILKERSGGPKRWSAAIWGGERMNSIYSERSGHAFCSPLFRFRSSVVHLQDVVPCITFSGLFTGCLSKHVVWQITAQQCNTRLAWR